MSGMVLLGSMYERQADLIDLGEVIREHLPDPALLVRLFFERFHVLQQQIPHRIGGFELQEQHAVGGEDAKQHLDPLLNVFHLTEALIHPRTHPSRDLLALLLIASTLGGDALLLMQRRSA